MLNRTKKIKEIMGNDIIDKGFCYLGKENGTAWVFERKVGDVIQNILIQQHTVFEKEYKIILWTSARGNGVKEIGSVLAEYKDKEYWLAETDEEFIEVLNFFASFIKNYGFDLLEDMKTEKPDSFETLERKAYFKLHWEELAEKYDKKYHILDTGTPEEKLVHIDDILFDNREAEDTVEKQEEVNEFLLGMAAILTKIILEYQGKGYLDCDGYRVEIILAESVLNVMPIFTVVQAWLDYHFDGKREIDGTVWGMTRMAVKYRK
ncbi:hypothetical protein [Butyrivibrio sp. INlla14]|uniref:hypothetical protein n=1 Tax=Butyrivibrio sp. INlla14 TaxID=1520808 RepID=UPI000876BD49|nr:hypothetical protein [Butyrivibrio sp. INlla14]SCY40220.1 hypothetical protein SAMN02910371_02150 [Butyrivibrio sp. INlla14]